MARLLAPLNDKDKKCVQFWYQITGNDKCLFNVVTKTQSGQLSTPFWTRNKNYGKRWNLGQVTVSSIEEYQIGFEAVVGNSWVGDVAIDDVNIENRECPPPGFCDFESIPRLCTWYNVQGKYFCKIITLYQYNISFTN